MRVPIEDVLFSSGKKKSNTDPYQLYCFTFTVGRCMVLLTVHWSHIYHIDGDLKLAI